MKIRSEHSKDQEVVENRFWGRTYNLHIGRSDGVECSFHVGASFLGFLEVGQQARVFDPLVFLEPCQIAGRRP